MKKITLLILFGFLYSWVTFAQVTVGTQSGTTNAMPISSCYGYSYSQQLLLQSDINAAGGNITSISFYYDRTTSTSNSSSAGWTIYMANSPKMQFENDDDWVPLANLTQVYSGTVTYPVAGNQMLITFDTPFAYNGTDNLVVAVDENQEGYDCSNYFGKTGAMGTGRSIYYRSDTINPDPASPPMADARTNFINNVILGGLQESCPRPTNFAVNGGSNTTAELSWTENGSSTEWQILYGPAGFNPNIDGTLVVDNDGTPGITITDLTENTLYDFYVRAICGVGEQSAQVGPLTYNTACGIAAVPYLQNFESAVIPDLPNCTTRENAGTGNNWVTATYTAGGFTGTVLKYGYDFNNPGNAWFYTQGIQLETGIFYQISYKYGNNSTSYTEKMKVAFGTSPNVASMTTQLADYPNIQHPAEVETITFTVPANGVYYFGFNAYSATNQLNLYLDDINVFVAPSCIAPSDLTVDSVSSDTAGISWTESADATQWEVLYGVTGFDPATQGTVIIVNGTPEATIDNLTPNTTYDFYVTAICDADDESFQIGPVTFTTSCVPGTIPFNEGFENGYVDQQAVGGCWSQISVVGTEKWTANSSLNTYNRAPYSGNWNAYLRYGNEDWMFYPLELTGGTPYELRFYARQDGATPANASILASYGTANNSAAMVNPIVASTPLINGNYQEMSGFFTPATSGTYFIGIKGTINGSPWYISLDDISVEQANGCLRPGNLAVANITETTADVSWSESGTATAWEVIYGIAGFDPLTEGTTLEVSGDPEAILTDLTTDTGYEFYVKAICGPGDESELSSVKYFFTGYCQYTSTSTTYYINDFSTQTGILNIINLNSGLSPGGYGNFTNKKVMTYPGGSFDFAAEFAGTSTYGFNMWIDYNGNLEFENSEKVYGSGAYVQNVSGTIVIPAGLANGDYRIRIVADYLNTNPLPCGTSSYGEAEDYTLTIGDIPTCLPPTNLIVISVDTDSANVSWTAQNAETEWNVVYGETGFDPETGGTTLVIQNTPEALLDGLISNTVYDFYVQSVCSSDDESAFAGPVTFTTSCIPEEIPFLESFENGYTHNTPLGGCWSQTNITGNEVWTANNSFTDFNRAPRTGSWNVFLRYGNSDWMYYPLNLTAGVAYELKFYARQDATSGVTVEAAYGTNSEPSAMTTTIVPTSNVTSGAYQEFSGYFSPPTSGTYYIGIKGTLEFAPFYMSIDDISVNEVSICLPPSDLMVDSVTENSATVSWTPFLTTETTWDVIYGPTGFDPETEGTIIRQEGDPQLTITDLVPSTGYQFYVRAVCDEGQVGEWVGPVGFDTQCVSVGIPYTLDFQEVMPPALPTCTSVENLSNGNNWETANVNEYGFTGRALRYKWSSNNAANSWFYTEGLNLSEGMEYKISYKYGNNGAGFHEKMKVAFGTAPTATSMTTELANYTDITGGTPNFEELVFTVPADGVYYFGFNVYSAADNFYLFLDDIHVGFAAECNPVTNVEIVNVTSTTVTVSWTASATASEGYIIDVFLEGANPTTDTPEQSLSVGTGATSATVSGLVADTAYDIYITSDCGSGNIIRSQVVSFNTTELGVDDNALAQITYFPNPVKGQLTITAAKTIESITVYNLLGQSILEVKPMNMNVILDMSTLPTGTYVLKANVANAASTFKIVKE